MHYRRWSICAAFVLQFALHSALADDRAKPETRTVKLPMPGGWTRAGAVELVRLPPGKVVLADVDGKPAQHAVKAVWMSRYETRQYEYFLFAQGADLVAADDVKNDWKRQEALQ